ncbi:MAG: hypothetical protein ACK55I_09915 [bacterium]
MPGEYPEDDGDRHLGDERRGLADAPDGRGMEHPTSPACSGPWGRPPYGAGAPASTSASAARSAVQRWSISASERDAGRNAASYWAGGR